MSADRILSRCRELAAITDVPGETTRTYLSPAMRRANEQLMAWVAAKGFTVRYDAAGNLRIVRAAPIETNRTFIVASHLDTIPNAGAFDGPLGIVLGLALLEEAPPLPFHLELIAFSEEEGVRFGFPFIGSKALTGELTDDLLARVDGKGTSVRQAITAYGLNPEELGEAQLHSGHFGYLEFHIEQGPVLEHEDRSLGIVTAIIGQSRLQLVFTGKANHAGTTPMHLRHDALAAAAEFVLAAERLGRNTPGLVATVGQLSPQPGAGNVIPGETVLSLDVRHADDTVRHGSVETLLKAAHAITQARGMVVSFAAKLDQPAVPMDPKLTALLAEAAAPCHPLSMTSGAGHDAMIVAPHLPAAMLFLRTPNGLSHHPDETVHPEDVQLAFETGLRFLERIADV
ncbi:allantoate amidohydrolase [Terriglobus albidus]|uniref:Allantoate amidohydrolase n=1 Tax=Terriglobus albidus TaxID=1592106 RepID=A0A5B9E9C4_9BACT|nr:allantoate amidohydrolase [Terriglobus albidus]QEE26656.1 allantoate amidohydrolase [Terriglobus albidus]